MVSPLDEPAAGNPHGGVCEGGGLGVATMNLNGHEAGNGGYSQGKSTAPRTSSTRPDGSPAIKLGPGYLPVFAPEGVRQICR